MLLPMFAWMAAFNLLPLMHVSMAFQDYTPKKGIFNSPWVGLEWFEYMFSLSDTPRIIANTVVISAGKIIFHLAVPLVFALLLHEVRRLKFKRGVQTVVILPHFLSWVILSGILLQIFSLGGPVNVFRAALGFSKISFFSQPTMFRQFVVGSDVWREFGFNAIIYIAALTNVDPGLYESAAIDGAGRWQRLFYITLPVISTTVVLLAVLSLGNVLNAGFEQILNLYNPLVYSTGDILDTWVYRTGFVSIQPSLAAAAGFLKSIVALIMITISYTMAYFFADYRIF
jgi:putative aldouronate transport system permease protein